LSDVKRFLAILSRHGQNLDVFEREETREEAEAFSETSTRFEDVRNLAEVDDRSENGLPPSTLLKISCAAAFTASSLAVSGLLGFK